MFAVEKEPENIPEEICTMIDTPNVIHAEEETLDVSVLFYTFCCDIGRHSKPDLIKVLNILLNSIHKKIPNYKILCFTNFRNKLNEQNNQKYNIEFREYYDKEKIKLYDSHRIPGSRDQPSWLNLSFNKINIYKDLYDEFNKDFCWIDLDTVICQDISYINDLSNIFIENGGTCVNKNRLFINDGSITVPRNRYVQGNFWKLNINLYNNLMATLDKIRNKNLVLRYDLQDLFSYYIYIENNGDYKDINILGNNIKPDSINGLCVWSKEGNTHGTMSGLNNLYFDNNLLKSKFYPDKNIDILSVTFFSLKRLYNDKKFKDLFE